MNTSFRLCDPNALWIKKGKVAAALPMDDTIAQLRLGDGAGGFGMKSECGHICVVASKSVGRRLVCRPVVLGMEDGGLLPERAMQVERDDITVPVGKGVRKHVGDQRTNSVAGRRPLIRQRAELQLDGPL